MTICKRVHYRGFVQGVGFRYTAKSVAAGFAVAGNVRNLPDGRVELVVEGEADEVTRFLAALADRMADLIADHSMMDEEPQGHSGFEILR